MGSENEPKNDAAGKYILIILLLWAALSHTGISISPVLGCIGLTIALLTKQTGSF